MAILQISASAHCDTMGGPTVADGYKAIESGNVNYVLKWVQPEYEKVMSLKDFDVNNLEAGREYIEAYVSFFKFAEGEEEVHVAADATTTVNTIAQDAV